MKLADYKSNRVRNAMISYRRNIKSIALMDDAVAEVEEWLPKLEKFDPTLNFGGNNINLGLYKITNMNQVGKALRIARKAGYDYPDRKALYYDAGGSRVWQLHKGETGLTIRANLSVDENAACRMVQVGVETYPKYEIRCD